MAREVSNVAPWAEIVPDAPYPMSIEEFDRWPEEPGWRYELVWGRLVCMPWPGGRHGRIVHYISRLLGNFAEPCRLGIIFDGAQFNFPHPGRTEPLKVAPDVAFVAAGRGPEPDTPEDERAWELAPDLVVEVASRESNQYRPAMAEKAHDYLDCGVRLVWIVYPWWKEVDIWWQGEHGHESQTLKADEQIDGRDMLPGFTRLVGDFFSQS